MLCNRSHLIETKKGLMMMIYLIFKPVVCRQEHRKAFILVQISVLTRLCKGQCENKNHITDIPVINLMFWIYVMRHDFGCKQPVYEVKNNFRVCVW
jgi:hypothetical protein